MVLASRLIGPKPHPDVRPVSLAVRRALVGYTNPVIVGCSGGADSLALAVCAIDLATRAGLPVHTITVDHQIRPHSAAEAEQVAALLQELGAHATVATVDPGELSGNSGPEGDAREGRYRAFALALKQLGLDDKPIWLGHTMDDQAEGTLLALGRGSGTRTLAGMRECGPIMRPLLGIRRAQTEACCTALDLEYVKDPTNKVDGPWKAADGTPLRRSAIREIALPALTMALGMDPTAALAKTAALTRADDDALEYYAHLVARQATVATDEDETRFNTEVLAGHPPATRRRVYRNAAGKLGGRALTFEHLQRIDQLVTNWRGQGTLNLPGVSVRRKSARNQLIFRKQL